VYLPKLAVNSYAASGGAAQGIFLKIPHSSLLPHKFPGQWNKGLSK